MTLHLSTEAAVRRLRADPAHAALVRDTYLDADPLSAAARFAASPEWREVLALLHPRVADATVVDLGAGIGLASRAFHAAGARTVLAVEPDGSDDVGRGALDRVCAGRPVRALAGFGEALPIGDATAGIVYARQVLHHTRDLALTLRECARVLAPGGVFLACREHVADTPEELAAFLAAHPVHQLTGGENAYRLAEYRAAIADAGLVLEREFGPWDSVINAYPLAATPEEIAALPARFAGERFGAAGRMLARLPGLAALARRRFFRPRPGRLYSFLARKP